MWYGKKTSAGQGIIIDEETGRTVAVTYDEKDFRLVAAAPEMKNAIERAIEKLSGLEEFVNSSVVRPEDRKELLRRLREFEIELKLADLNFICRAIF